jgi:hypothetical protein
VLARRDAPWQLALPAGRQRKAPWRTISTKQSKSSRLASRWCAHPTGYTGSNEAVHDWLVVCGVQEGRYVRPGWVKMRYTADGVTVAWHPAVHQLSLPVAVVAAPDWPLEPVGEAHFA